MVGPHPVVIILLAITIATYQAYRAAPSRNPHLHKQKRKNDLSLPPTDDEFLWEHLEEPNPQGQQSLAELMQSGRRKNEVR
jgi:hypothetical protein